MGLLDGVVDTLAGGLGRGVVGLIPGADNLSPSMPPIYTRLPQNKQALINKYRKLGPILQQLDPRVVNSVIDMDSQRVARGGVAMTEQQTLAALKTVYQGEPFTPAPDRSPWNIPGNIVRDLGDIVKSIPQLPKAIYHEVQQIPNMSEHIAQAQREGMNSIAAIASAPGVRMLPGSYIASNLAQGKFSEIATHPLMAGLDVLPLLSKFAETTAVGRAAAAQAAETGVRTKPIMRALGSRLYDPTDPYLAKLGEAYKFTTPEGKVLARREVLNNFMQETKIGQGVSQLGGQANRAAARVLNGFRSYIGGVQQGTIKGTGQLGGKELEELAHRAYVFVKEKYPDFTEDDIIRLTELYKLGDDSALTAEELAMKHDLMSLTQEFGDHIVNRNLNELGKFTYDNGRQEFLPWDQYTKLMKAMNERNSATRKYELRTRIEYGDPQRTTDNMLNDLRKLSRSDDWRSPKRDMKSRWKQDVTAVLLEMQTRGFDVDGLMQFLHKKPTDQVIKDFQKAVDQWTPVNHDLLSKDSVIDQLKKLKVKNVTGVHPDVRAQKIIAAIQDQNWPRVTQELANTRLRSAARFPDQLERSIKAIRDRERFIGELNITEDQLNRLRRNYANRAARTIPARYMPRVIKETKQRFQQTIESDFGELGISLTPEQATQLVDHIAANVWMLPEGLSNAFDAEMRAAEAGQLLSQYKKIAHEVGNTWQMMRDQGVEPVFIHNVRPSKVGGVMYALPGEVVNDLSQVKERTLDAASSVNNFRVAITGQAQELLNREASILFQDFIRDNYGVDEMVLRKAYIERAKQNLAMGAGGGMRDLQAEVTRLMDSEWTSFNPDYEGYFWNRNRQASMTLDRYRIPKSLAKTIVDLHSPKDLFRGAMDSPTRLFRMAVVALSPRTLLYNIIGGGVMAAGQGGLGVFRHAREAWNMVNDVKNAPNELKELGLGMQGELFKELDLSSNAAKAQGAASWMAGTWARKVWDAVQEAKAQGRFPKVGEGINKIAQKSYDFNSLIDDWYRAMTYLEGKGKGLKKGMSEEAAVKAGLELTRKTLQDWSSMTPLERSIMKSIFPFYGFMSHSLKYVLNYPFDHPLRMEILSKLAEAEIADGKELLPHRFLGWLFIGSPDEQGKQTALNASSLNPFGDVANLFTLSGFLGATNPVISTILESVGVEQGKSELYPSLRYNPETGRLDATHSNPLLSFMHNTIPQSEILSSLIGINTDFNDQVRRDPVGALRRLASAGGLPTLWRQYNPYQEQMKAEVARLQSATDVKNDALRSGSLTNLMRYPSLRQLPSKVATIPPEVLEQYQVTQGYAEQTKEELRNYVFRTGGNAGNTSGQLGGI